MPVNNGSVQVWKSPSLLASHIQDTTGQFVQWTGNENMVCSNEKHMF